MKFIQYAEKVEKIKYLAQRKQAGKPQQLAKRLYVSESTLHVTIPTGTLDITFPKDGKQTTNLGYASVAASSLAFQIHDFPPQWFIQFLTFWFALNNYHL